MTKTHGLFDAAHAARMIKERGLGLGCALTVLPSAGSASHVALAAARSSIPHGAVFLVEKQVHARARNRRVWISQPGASLTFSVVLRPGLPTSALPRLLLLGTLGLRDALAQHLDHPVLLKWPNDVFCRSRKLGAVFVNPLVRGPELEAVAMDFGINVRPIELPEQLRAGSSSLALSGAPGLAREELLVDVLSALESRLRDNLTTLSASLLEELSRHDLLLGKQVTIGRLSGRALGIDHQGRLLVQSNQNGLVRVGPTVVNRVRWSVPLAPAPRPACAVASLQGTSL